MRKQGTASRLGVAWLLIAVSLLGSRLALGEDLTARQLIDRMQENTLSLEDLSATLTIQTYRDAKVVLTQTMSIALKQPDRMRQEYLAPDYLAGNVTIIAGNAMSVYIAASNQWYEKDLASLSPSEQPWVLFRNMLRGVRSQFEDYAFGRADDVDPAEYHLVGVPATSAAIYGRIELWIDATDYFPRRWVLYDTDGKFLVESRFLEPTQLAEKATIPMRIEAYREDGTLQNVITYDQVVVNSGLSDSLFVKPEGTHG